MRKIHTTSPDYTSNNLIEALTSTKGKTSFSDGNRGQVYEYYLSGDIEAPEEYIEWFNEIRHAGAEDVVKIYINSCGGDLFTALQFVRLLRDTEATTIGCIEGACMSAATFIFLACENYQVSSHASFMAHNYSGGTFGKGGEMANQMRFEEKWSEAYTRDIYEGFLSEDEIKGLLDGRDIWLGAQDVATRLNKLIEVRQKASEAQPAE